MALISLMSSKYKQVYGAAAEVLGISLANMEEDIHVRLQYCIIVFHDHSQTAQPSHAERTSSIFYLHINYIFLIIYTLCY